MDNQLDPLLINGNGRQVLLTNLLALRQWTYDSIKYVRQRNHLDKDEKQGFYDRLEQYHCQLTNLIDTYGSTEHVPAISDESAKAEIETRLKIQITLNRHARFYEVPLYPLVESGEPISINFKVADDSMAPKVYAGDELRGAECRLDDLKPDDGAVLVFRYNKRYPRKYVVGRVHEINDQYIKLAYQNPSIVLPALHRQTIVFAYKVKTISRDWPI